MVIHIKYFASLRETLGKQEEQLDMGEQTTVADVWRAANPDRPAPDNTLAAVNQVYSRFDAPVQSGDEVAFFPPVTGG